MIRAFLLISACSLGGEEPSTVGVDRVVGSGAAIRNCLRVATGLHQQGDRSGASDHVRTCYNQHVAPLETTLREHNRRATLSLEYGFGVVANSMTRRRSEPGVVANMLADRVDSVLETIPKAPEIEADGEPVGTP